MKVDGSDTTKYTYDLLGNLTKIVLPNGTVIEYLIDAQNRRVGKKLNGAIVARWIYSGQLSPVAELDSLGAIVARYVYATHVNVPDYVVKAGTTYRVVTDHLGSVRLVVDQATGTVAQRMDYDAWGNVTTDSNPGFTPFGYAGGLYETQTKLVRFGARDYDAANGRWDYRDPLGLQYSVNLFSYSKGDPINVADPSGLWPPGHHYMPQALTKKIPLSDDARDFFMSNTTGDIGPHGWSKEHAAYNDAVEKLFDKWTEKRGICPLNMSTSEAEGFLKAIKGSRALAIKGFLEDLGKGLGAVGTFFQALEFYHTAQRAEAHGLSPWLQYLIESGMAENPYIES
jgi:RHS repeat-associated protein